MGNPLNWLWNGESLGVGEDGWFNEPQRQGEHGGRKNYENLNSDDVAIVGGRNASLGEMIGTLKDQWVYKNILIAFKNYVETTEDTVVFG